MREILFRGKEINNSRWVEGDLLRLKFYPDDSEHSIVFTDSVEYPRSKFSGAFEVVPETIGQYTGLKDKNGKRIFEGDIFQCKDARGYVCFGTYPSAYESRETHVGFYIRWIIDTMLRIDLAFWANEREIEVIGNIHDNAELLEVGE